MCKHCEKIFLRMLSSHFGDRCGHDSKKNDFYAKLGLKTVEHMFGFTWKNGNASW